MKITLKKWGLYLLFAAFLAPLALAFIFYYGHLIKPSKGTEHGILLQPTLNFSAIAPKSSIVPPSARSWQLMYVVANACDSQCEQTLHLLRQLHVALGKDSDRVQRVLVVIDSQQPLNYKPGPALSPTTAAYSVSNAQWQQFLNNSNDAQTMAKQGGLYIVDPNGNAMLYYSPIFPPKGVLEDIKHLLKLSHIG